MNWQDIFNIGLDLGRKYDIRVNQNPSEPDFCYSDCTIINNETGIDIKKVYIAVDVGVAELMLIRELNKDGASIDGIIAHHPMSSGAYRLTEVIGLQKYNWEKYGVSTSIADRISKQMKEEEDIELRAHNFLAVESASRLLEMPVMCIHTAIDNIVQGFFEKILLRNNFSNIGEILKRIEDIPECKKSASYGDGPFIPNNADINVPPGKIMVDMTGGMDPDSSIFKYLKKADINTLIGMHYNLDNIKAIKKNKLNTIICGHMACDSIGLNIYSDMLEQNGLEVVAGSGFYRHKR